MYINKYNLRNNLHNIILYKIGGCSVIQTSRNKITIQVVSDLNPCTSVLLMGRYFEMFTPPKWVEMTG